MKKRFLDWYPGEVLDRSTMPGPQFLEKVLHQNKEDHPLRWLPWDHILSVEQEEDIVRHKNRSRTPSSDIAVRMPIRWEAQLKLPDGGISGAPYFVTRMQTVRRNAYAMCGYVHLQRWKAIDAQFQVYYTKQYSSNLRPPNLEEAIETDPQVWTQALHDG